MRAEEHETKRVAAETTEKTQFKIPISLIQQISSEKELLKFDLMEKSKYKDENFIPQSSALTRGCEDYFMMKNLKFCFLLKRIF